MKFTTVRDVLVTAAVTSAVLISLAAATHPQAGDRGPYPHPQMSAMPTFTMWPTAPAVSPSPSASPSASASPKQSAAPSPTPTHHIAR